MARLCDWGGGGGGCCGGGGGGGGAGGLVGAEAEGALHSVAFALGQMQDCMRSMRCKMDRTDRAVRCVAQRLKVQRRIIQKVDRRIDVLEQGPSSHAFGPGSMYGNSTGGGFGGGGGGCSGCGGGGGCGPATFASPAACFPYTSPSGTTSQSPAATASYSRCCSSSCFSPPRPAARFCPRAPARSASCRPQRCARRRPPRGCRPSRLPSCTRTLSSVCVCPSCPSSTDSCVGASPPDTCTSPCTSPVSGPGPCPFPYPSRGDAQRPPAGVCRARRRAPRAFSPVRSRSLEVCGVLDDRTPADTCEDCPSLASLGRRLMKAAQKGNVKKVRCLLERGADVNFEASGKWTPLHRAAAKAHCAVVELLLGAGANANARNMYGFTALHIAAYDDFRGKCLQLLIDHGADTGSRNRFGRTALHYAAECGNVAAVRVLLRGGACKEAKDDDGRSPLDVARTVCIRRLLRPAGRRKIRARSCSVKKCCPPAKCICNGPCFTG